MGGKLPPVLRSRCGVLHEALHSRCPCNGGTFPELVEKFLTSCVLSITFAGAPQCSCYFVFLYEKDSRKLFVENKEFEEGGSVASGCNEENPTL